MRRTLIILVVAASFLTLPSPAAAYYPMCTHSLQQLASALENDTSTTEPSEAVIQAALNAQASCPPADVPSAGSVTATSSCLGGSHYIGDQQWTLRFWVFSVGYTYNPTGRNYVIFPWTSGPPSYRVEGDTASFNGDSNGLGWIRLASTYHSGSGGVGEVRCTSGGTPCMASGWAQYRGSFWMDANAPGIAQC